MSWLDTITITAPSGGFLPTTFQDLLQRRITLDGLDPRYYHTLVAVAVADDGGSAALQILTEPIDPLNLTRTLRVHDDTPLAHVRVVGEDGSVLCEGQYTAPLQHGQTVAVGQDYYLVTEIAWPNRTNRTANPGELDWQQATVIPAVPPTMLPDLSPEQASAG
jgi:hypothetical protein